jgi:protein-disulfide isomerase
VQQLVFRGVVFGFSAMVVACGSPQRPDPRVAKLETRLAVLEDRLDNFSQQRDSDGERVTELRERVAVLEKSRDRPRLLQRDPNPEDVFAVPIEAAPYVGPMHAWVTIVTAFEFACPFCERSRATLDELRKEYGEEIKIVYRHFIVHPQTASIPAYAACAAHAQGGFKAMYDLIWEDGFKANRNLSRANMLALARRAGLSIKRFERDMDGVCVATVRADQAQMALFGVSGTPAFFINGRFLSGAQAIDRFKAIIDEELRKARNSGIVLEKYYDHLLETGKRRFDGIGTH